MRKKMGTVLDEELLTQARLIAVKEGKKLSQVFEEALREYLAKGEGKVKGKSVVEETKGALKADKKLVMKILEEEPFYGI